MTSMWLEDFHLAMKELRLVGARLELEDSPLPGFKKVKGVRVDGEHALLLRIKNEEILEVVKLHKKSPRRMDPDRFIEEVGKAACSGDAVID